MSLVSSTVTVSGCTLTGGASTSDNGIVSNSGGLTLDGNTFKDWNTGVALSNNATSAADFFGLPPGQVIEIGARVEI